MRPILRLAALALIVFHGLSVFNFCIAEVGEQEAAQAVTRADEAVKAAYEAVIEAEKAGGDVSEQISELNKALISFNECKIAYNSGMYDLVSPLTEKTIETAHGVLEASVELKGSAELVRETALKNTLLTSIVIVSIIVLSGFAGWRYFKNYYLQNMVRLRPEVNVDEPE